MESNGRSSKFSSARSKALTKGKRRTQQILKHQVDPRKSVPAREVKELLHELHGQQVELQLQNEEIARARDELSRQQNELRTLIEHSPDAIARLDREFRFIYANAAALSILHKSWPELNGTCVTNIQSRDPLLQRVEQTLKQVLSSAKESVVEYTVNISADAEVVLETRHVPEFGDDGSICSILLIGRDVTARRQAERELLSANETITKILESIQDGFISFDRNWRYAYVNAAAGRYLQRNPKDMIGKVAWQSFPESAELPFWTQFHRAVENNEVVCFEGYLPEPLCAWYECRCYPRADGLSVFFTDTTERRQAEEARHLNERRLQIALKTGPIALFSQDTNLKYIWVCSRREHLNPDIVLGRQDEDLYPAEEAQQLTALKQQVLNSGQPRQGEIRTICGGREYFYDISIDPLFDEEGLTIGVIGAEIDVTERQLAKQRLQELTDHLEQHVAERTKEAESRAKQLRALATEISKIEQRERRRLAQLLHDDLQQLLAAARISLGILSTQLKDPKQIKLADKVDMLVDRSIESSRSLSKELSPPILSDRGLGPALQWYAEWYAESFGIKVDVRTDPEAEPANEDDKFFLFSAVRELLMNVKKHAECDQAAVFLERIGDRLRVTVADEGPGFDQKQRQLGEHEDTGFGLFSIRERLTAVDGWMEVDSGNGEGTKVMLWLPAHPAHQPEPPIEAPKPELNIPGPVNPTLSINQPVAHDESKIQVLLVDDHKIMREGLASLLRCQPDMAVAGEASNGIEALTLAETTRPDVVIMDAVLPGLDGVEATRQLKERSPDVAVIGLSMFEHSEMAQMMLGAGAANYLSKSGPADELITTIRNLCPLKANAT